MPGETTADHASQKTLDNYSGYFNTALTPREGPALPLWILCFFLPFFCFLFLLFPKQNKGVW